VHLLYPRSVHGARMRTAHLRVARPLGSPDSYNLERRSRTTGAESRSTTALMRAAARCDLRAGRVRGEPPVKRSLVEQQFATHPDMRDETTLHEVVHGSRGKPQIRRRRAGVPIPGRWWGGASRCVVTHMMMIQTCGAPMITCWQEGPQDRPSRRTTSDESSSDRPSERHQRAERPMSHHVAPSTDACHAPCR
jgi:hypothetical protein